MYFSYMYIYAFFNFVAYSEDEVAFNLEISNQTSKRNFE